MTFGFMMHSVHTKVKFGVLQGSVLGSLLLSLYMLLLSTTVCVNILLHCYANDSKFFMFEQSLVSDTSLRNGQKDNNSDLHTHMWMDKII